MRPRTAGSPPKWLLQKPSLRTATWLRPTWSASGPKAFPMAGAIPKTVKKFPDTAIAGRRSAGIPGAERLKLELSYAATWLALEVACFSKS